MRARPNRTRLEQWLAGFTPLTVFTHGYRAVVAWTKDDVCRWVIKTPEQRLKHIDAIAKDASVFDEQIRRRAKVIEVWDMVDGHLYTITVAEFDAHKAAMDTRGGKQWYVHRGFWRRRLFGAPQPKQGALM